MPNKRYIAGRQFEYKVKRHLEKGGWKVLRTSGSHGLFDLIALKLKKRKHSSIPYLVIDFWQLKKNITDNMAIKLVEKIQKEIFKKVCYIVQGKEEGKKYISLLRQDNAPNENERLDILITFGVIYTLPKKKKIDKKRCIIKMSETLQGGEKVAEATSG
jgi:hypothetical protein